MPVMVIYLDNNYRRELDDPPSLMYLFIQNKFWRIYCGPGIVLGYGGGGASE